MGSKVPKPYLIHTQIHYRGKIDKFHEMIQDQVFGETNSKVYLICILSESISQEKNKSL